MRSLRRIALIAALIAALAPSPAALAQSAGDEQYTDPLAPTAQQDSGSDAADDPAPAAEDPSPAADHGDPARSATAGASAAQADSVEDPADSPAPKQLPRTGFSVVLLFATGGTMLIAGVAIARISARPASAAGLRSLR